MARPSCSSLLDEDVTTSAAEPSLYSQSAFSRLRQVAYSKPNKKGKRRLVVEEDDDDLPPKLTLGAQIYVDALAAKYGTTPNSRILQATVDNKTETVLGSATSTHAIKLRLVKNRAPCNIHNLSCDIPMCGRAFHNVEVLAFHMSYAHSDVSHLASSALCFICGLQLNTSKGKVAHLTTRHRKIFAAHNIQCLEQREPVISPFAPAAIRLEATRFDTEITTEPEPEIVYDNTTLADICDMIAIPHEDDYPPAQSQPTTWTD